MAPPRKAAMATSGTQEAPILIDDEEMEADIDLHRDTQIFRSSDSSREQHLQLGYTRAIALDADKGQEARSTVPSGSKSIYSEEQDEENPDCGGKARKSIGVLQQSKPSSTYRPTKRKNATKKHKPRHAKKHKPRNAEIRIAEMDDDEGDGPPKVLLLGDLLSRVEKLPSRCKRKRSKREFIGMVRTNVMMPAGAYQRGKNVQNSARQRELEHVTARKGKRIVDYEEEEEEEAEVTMDVAESLLRLHELPRQEVDRLHSFREQRTQQSSSHLIVEGLWQSLGSKGGSSCNNEDFVDRSVPPVEDRSARQRELELAAARKGKRPIVDNDQEEEEVTMMDVAESLLRLHELSHQEVHSFREQRTQQSSAHLIVEGLLQSLGSKGGSSSNNEDRGTPLRKHGRLNINKGKGKGKGGHGEEAGLTSRAPSKSKEKCKGVPKKSEENGKAVSGRTCGPPKKFKDYVKLDSDSTTDSEPPRQNRRSHFARDSRNAVVAGCSRNRALGSQNPTCKEGFCSLSENPAEFREPGMREAFMINWEDLKPPKKVEKSREAGDLNAEETRRKQRKPKDLP